MCTYRTTCTVSRSLLGDRVGRPEATVVDDHNTPIRMGRTVTRSPPTRESILYNAGHIDVLSLPYLPKTVICEGLYLKTLWDEPLGSEGIVWIALGLR